jgi:hypothetical protein
MIELDIYEYLQLWLPISSRRIVRLGDIVAPVSICDLTPEDDVLRESEREGGVYILAIHASSLVFRGERAGLSGCVTVVGAEGGEGQVLEIDPEGFGR